MFVSLALLLAAGSTPTANEPVAKKPKLKCEWIHEVGSARPRRECVRREPKEQHAHPDAPAQATDQTKPEPKPGSDN
jgi:hypothetical protein